MLVWLIKDGEMLPTRKGGRSMRMGMLAEALLKKGHRVVWWSSTFSHQEKKLLHAEDQTVAINDRYTLRLLHAGSYERNFSYVRYRHHKALRRKFERAIASAERPDAIVCAFPTIDLAHACSEYARTSGVPLVVDVRDLWPDIFLWHLPAPLKPLGRLFLRKDFAMTKEALTRATSLVAISQGSLDWALRYAGRPQGTNDKVFYTSYPLSPAGPTKPSDFVRRLEEEAGRNALFTFIGTFGKSYDLKTVVAAARLLESRGVGNVKIVLAGAGENYAEIESLSKGLKNVWLTGWLVQEDLSALLRRSHAGIVCCRSVEDALPNKFFEYLSAGLPLLSSLEGEAEGIIARNGVGYSYACDDAETLAGLMAAMAADPQGLARMSAASAKLFEEKFHPSLVYSSYVEHVEALARHG